MPCGHAAGTQSLRIVQEQAKFNLAVAQHIRIRRAPGGILAEEVRKDLVPIGLAEIDPVQGDVQFPAYRPGILEIAGRGAIGFVVFPVSHVQGFHSIALLLEQQRGYSRIDAPRQGHHDFFGTCDHLLSLAMVGRATASR